MFSGFMDKRFPSAPERFLVGTEQQTKAPSPACAGAVFPLKPAPFSGNGGNRAAGARAAPSGCYARGVGGLLLTSRHPQADSFAQGTALHSSRLLQQ